jgi:hypothetical protein
VCFVGRGCWAFIGYTPLPYVCLCFWKTGGSLCQTDLTCLLGDAAASQHRPPQLQQHHYLEVDARACLYVAILMLYQYHGTVSDSVACRALCSCVVAAC